MPEKIKITFLGTSASIPSANRNPSAILLTYKDENILIDCAEGTQRQMRKAKLNPLKVNKILVTHWHGDHILGMPPLFQTMVLTEYNKEMQVYGPKNTKYFMRNFINTFAPVFKSKAKTHEIEKPGIFFEKKDFYLQSEKMEHGTPANAYNFVIKDKIRIDKTKLKKAKIPQGKHLSPLSKGKDITYDKKKYKAKDLTYIEKGKKITFILDTIDNKRIVPFAKDADLLICESSFSSELKAQAKDHLHLTSEQAGMIAKKAKVKELILTHISQRYEHNTKELLKDAKKNFKNVKIAKDFDEVII
jgi:ribonuclease Z